MKELLQKALVKAVDSFDTVAIHNLQVIASKKSRVTEQEKQWLQNYLS